MPRPRQADLIWAQGRNKARGELRRRLDGGEAAGAA